MKTWRERSVEARARGKFTEEDFKRWQQIWTCPAAEYALAYGVGRTLPLSFSQASVAGPCFRMELHEMGGGLHVLMIAKDFDGVDALLDAIEDRALELKRISADGP